MWPRTTSIRSRRLAPAARSFRWTTATRPRSKALMRSGFTTLWIADHHLLQTHTCALAKLMGEADLKLVGYFKTNLRRQESGLTQLLPLSRCPTGPGRSTASRPASPRPRPGPRTATAGPPATSTARRTCPPPPRPTAAWKTRTRKAQFVFNEAARALEAAEALGQKIDLLDEMMDRETRLKSGKDGRLAVEIEKREGRRAKTMPGWIAKKDKWVRIFDVKTDAEKSDELGFSRTRQCSPRVGDRPQGSRRLGHPQGRRVDPRAGRQRQDALAKPRTRQAGGRGHHG